MKLIGASRMALKALGRNPMRAMLTTLGIVIGVGAVIAMMEIGQGSSTALQKSIATMGANVILVRPGALQTHGVSGGAASGTTLTPKDAEAIERECESVRLSAPVVRARTQVVYGNRNWAPSNMFGTTPDFLVIRAWGEMAEGEMFTDQDVAGARRVCVLGQTVARELFQGQSPVGKSVRIKDVAFKVVGVLGVKGANMMGMDQDDVLVAPWTTIKYRVAGSKLGSTNQSASSGDSDSTSGSYYPSEQTSLYPEQSSTQAKNTPVTSRISDVDEIMVSAWSAAEINTAVDEISQLLRQRHRIRPGQDDDFTIRNMTELTDTLSSTATLMANLLLSVAMISLVVGGVGIMNIMLVSVTERTREIGLRMAVGARGRDILRQFLVEAVVLCLAGGALGIVLGHGGSSLVRLVLKWPVETSIEAIVLAVAVSAAIGVIFGFYPAWRASRLDPIEALRYE